MQNTKLQESKNNVLDKIVLAKLEVV